MREALLSVLNYTFTVLGFERVQAQVMPPNGASMQLLLSLGFSQEAYRRQAGFWRGQFHDLVLLSLLSSEFVQADRGSAIPT